MTTTAAPFGLRPVRHLAGGTLRPRALPGGIAAGYGTAIYEGSPIKLVTGGTFEIIGAGEAISAVFAGVEFKDDDGEYKIRNYWPTGASARSNIVVWFWGGAEISLIEFEMQSNGSIAATGLGDCADIVNQGSGNVTGGQGHSTAALSSSLEGAGNSGQMKITGVSAEPDNAWGDTYTIVKCIVNERNTGFVPGNAI